MENKIRWRYDAQVAVEDTASQRNGFVFVDDGRDDVGSSRATIMYESQPDTYSQHDTADDARHERFVFYKRFFNIYGRYREEYGSHQHTEYGTYAILPADDAYGCYEKNSVDSEIGNGNGYFRTEENKSR